MKIATFKVTSKSGVGKDLIWARMDIFKDRPFGNRFESLPTLQTNEKLHIGLEVNAVYGNRVLLAEHMFADSRPSNL